MKSFLDSEPDLRTKIIRLQENPTIESLANARSICHRISHKLNHLLFPKKFPLCSLITFVRDEYFVQLVDKWNPQSQFDWFLIYMYFSLSSFYFYFYFIVIYCTFYFFLCFLSFSCFHLNSILFNFLFSIMSLETRSLINRTSRERFLQIQPSEFFGGFHFYMMTL